MITGPRTAAEVQSQLLLTVVAPPPYLLDQHVYSETLDTTALPAKMPEMMWLYTLWKG